MDSIRLSQVNEVLNYDKNINAMVFNLEKKRTAMFPDEEVLPYSQIGEEAMTGTKDGSNSLKVMLDAQLASVAQLSGHVNVDAGYASAIGNIGQIQTIIQTYNQVVGPYTATQLTQQTKELILFEMRSLLDRLGRLDRGLTRVLGDELEGEAEQICVTALLFF